MSLSLLVIAAVVAAALVSMGVYAWRGARRDRDVSAKGSRLALGLGDFLVHWFMWALAPIEGWLLRTGISPDTLNYAGLCFGLASGTAIALGQLEAGGWAILLGGVCDVLDGRVARARGLTSPFGKFLDSTLDRFVEVFAFLGFVVYLRREPLGPLIAAAAMAGSLLVSYARARGESTGVDCRGGLMQRAERLVLMFAACLGERPLQAHLGWPAGRLVLYILGAIAVGTLGTAVYRTVWIAARLRGAEGPKPRR
jgi:CDP-diacylglycerol--glycerol-3-phosphate 3-phosphatidyltransferase